MTDAELRALLLDCLVLWGVTGRVEAVDACVLIVADSTLLRIEHAPPELLPVRWLLHHPGRSPRALPSIGAALTALRNALGADAGASLRIGAAPAGR